MDLALNERLVGLLEIAGAPDENVAWVVGVTPEMMWQLTDRPAGMTGILWHRLAQLHGVEYELLVGDSTEDALTAVRAALPSSPLTQLERGDLDRWPAAPRPLRRRVTKGSDPVVTPSASG